MSKIIGVDKLLIAEYSYSLTKTNKSEKAKGVNFIKHVREEIFDEEEREKLKQYDKKPEKKKITGSMLFNVFHHDSGRIMSKEEYELLIKNLI